MSFSDDLIRAVPNLRAYALSLTRAQDRADDLVQETLLKAWAKQDSFEPGTNIVAWTFTILRNSFYSSHRKSKREVSDSDGALTGRLATPPQQDGHVDLADLQTAIQELPTEQREALLLVTMEGMSYEEAAQICDCAVGTVKSRVSRARTRISELLGVDSSDNLGQSGIITEVIGKNRAAF